MFFVFFFFGCWLFVVVGCFLVLVVGCPFFCLFFVVVVGGLFVDFVCFFLVLGCSLFVCWLLFDCCFWLLLIFMFAGKEMMPLGMSCDLWIEREEESFQFLSFVHT